MNARSIQLSVMLHNAAATPSVHRQKVDAQPVSVPEIWAVAACSIITSSIASIKMMSWQKNWYSHLSNLLCLVVTGH
jgi:hypothetical protein